MEWLKEYVFFLLVYCSSDLLSTKDSTWVDLKLALPQAKWFQFLCLLIGIIARTLVMVVLTVVLLWTLSKVIYITEVLKSSRNIYKLNLK